MKHSSVVVLIDGMKWMQCRVCGELSPLNSFIDQDSLQCRAGPKEESDALR